jgi:hypothetical protein
MRPSTTAAWAVAVTALLTTAACGGGTHHAAAKPEAHPTTVAEAADSAAGKAVAAMVARVDTRSSARMVMIQHRGDQTATMSGLRVWGSNGAGLDVTAPPAALGVQQLNHSASTEMRMMGGWEYIEIDPVKRGALKGKRWLRYSEATIAGDALTGEMTKAAEQSPVDDLRAPALAGKVTLVGHETMDNQLTIHYRATVAADPYLVKLKHVPATTEADVWVGPDGYPVRYVSDDGKQRNISDFQSFGDVGTILDPPAAQTVDVTADARTLT